MIDPKPNLNWPKCIDSERKPEASLQCPNCFNRSFRMSAVQSLERQTIWVCTECGHDDEQIYLKTNTPKGCISTAQEKPAE